MSEYELLFPSIKDDAVEAKVDIVKTDILPMDAKGTVYFSLDWRFDKSVTDCLGNKYGGKEDDYPESPDEDEVERFAIGPSAAANLLKKQDCPYVAKMNEIIKADKRINIKNIVGFYLFDIDSGESNSQKFIVLTSKMIYIRFNTKQVEEYSFEELVFDGDGIRKRDYIESIDDLVVDYSMEEDFLNYVNDLLVLNLIKMQGINETHPVVNLSVEKKEAYLSFLVDVAMEKGGLDVYKLLRLEFMAREFKIAAAFLVKCVAKSYKKAISDTRMSNVFTGILRNVLKEELRYIFYQDILEMLTSEDGVDEKRKIYKLVKDKKYAGEQFTEAYVEFLVNRNQAALCLQNAISAIEYPKVNCGNVYRMQRYGNALNLQFVKAGVDINGN